MIKRYLKEEDDQTARSIIGFDDEGSIYLDAGSVGNLVTQLGSSESKFRPYIDKIGDMIYLYTYAYTKEFVPANFDSVDEFLEVLESQAINNESIVNYLRLSAESMSKYLQKMRMIDDNTYFIVINNGSNIVSTYSNFFKETFENVHDDIIFVKPELQEDELYIAEDTPQKEKQYLEDILDELQKVDAHLTFDDVDIDSVLYRYLRGFVDVRNTEKLQNIRGNIILVSDFYSNAHISIEVKDHIEKIINSSVRLSIMIGKKD